MRKDVRREFWRWIDFACYAWAVGAREDPSAAERETGHTSGRKNQEKRDCWIKNSGDCNEVYENANHAFRGQVAFKITELMSLRGHQSGQRSGALLLTGNDARGATGILASGLNHVPWLNVTVASDRGPSCSGTLSRRRQRNSNTSKHRPARARFQPPLPQPIVR